ncbi:protein CROWDED NUCLEI 4-like isoform X2 [Pyrus communis]|uniref:protein CROWDED NUCLEI 4-like isoform X2 n=1 Tax=Pyrus communis TaxID=23211 RepID=UPI0035BFDADB
MASPQSELFARTPSSGRALSITPGSRILQSPGAVSDEAIWKRFKEAGFDEESIKRRDKAALITYIAKLEAEIFNHQHHMGLLILERKELASNYEQIKASAKTAELLHNRDKAADLSALADARKREECLKKTVGFKEECIASIEKAMHELRAESAEMKVAADSKLSEARKMVEDAQKKFTDAEGKLHAAESLQAEACRFHRIAERKMREVEAREDDLRRNILSFKMDCETKEKEISLDRQSLNERQKSLQQEQDRLLDAQALLNQREDFIFGRSQELNQLEKELEDVKANIEKERRALDEEKLNLELTGASLINREEALTRREVLLNKKEQEILALQEKLMSKESDVIKKAIASHEADLRKKKSEFETELDVKRKSFEDKLEAKRRAWELREVDLNQREDLLCEREHDLEVQLRALMDREKEVAEMSNLVGEKEKNLREAEKEFEQNSGMLQIEREEIIKMKLELQRSLDSLEEKRKQLDCARERFELLKSETSELSDLEIKLKEEIDLIRAQKLELMEEADKLSIEKAKFESEWELIDEKREELRKEVECVAEERLAFSKFIKDEHDNLRREKDEMRDRHKRDVESLVSEREDFMSKMVHERTEWFSKMQKERADFLLEIEIRKGELENCIDQKHEELECSLKEKEIAFEQEKKNEVEIISSLKEEAAKERDQVALERKRLESERIEINLDRERRDREWAELCNSIEELRVQREKLKEQRELLHADREEILGLIQHLKELEHLKAALDSASVAEMQQSDLVPRSRKTSRRSLKQTSSVRDANVNLHNEVNADNISNPSMLKIGLSPSSSARFSWLRRWRELMFKNSPEKHQLEFEESPVISLEKTSLTVTEQIETSSKYDGHRNMGNGNSPAFFSKRQCAFGEPKVIVEVPFVGDLSNRTKDSESEIKEFDGESCDPIVSEQVFKGGRKRRVEQSLSAGCFDPLLEPRQNVKKRRQQQDAVLNSLEHANSQCVASVPSHQIHEDAEEGTVSIVDKVTKVTKVIFGETLTGTLSSEDESEAQNSVVEPDHVKNGVLPCDTKAQEKMQELNLGDAGQVIDHDSRGRYNRKEFAVRMR